MSPKSWYLVIRNGPIARGFWNLFQSIEQKLKNLHVEKFRYRTDIKITFWDTAQYFHSKQVKKNHQKEEEKITEIKPGWIKKIKNKNKKKSYCDLLVHASFTKYTGPAKVFSNNIKIY